MRQIYKVNAKMVSDGVAEVFANATDEQFGKITIGYSDNFDDDIIVIYDGEINTEDPGIPPLEEFSSRDEALESEYSDVCKRVFVIADAMLDEENG